MAGKKSHWLDEDTDEPMIAERAQRLEAFLAAMADGRVDEGELQAQQQRHAGAVDVRVQKPHASP